MTRYDFIAKFYDWLLKPIEKTINDYRKEFVPLITGKTLDVAAGTGNNIKYYPNNSKVSILDSSKNMLKIAKKKSEHRKDLSINFIDSKIEDYFSDKKYDTILSIDSLCSVQNVEESVVKMKDLLDDNGKIIFVEHMLTNNKLKNIILFIANFVTYPLLKSSMIRKSDIYIKKHFRIIEEKNLRGSFKLFIVKKK